MLVIFARYPIAGQAKTRLIPALGAEGAAQLQRRMNQHTIAMATACAVPIQIRFCGGTATQLRQHLGNELNYQPQGDGDLGDRMANAFHDGFQQGHKQIVIIGTDCPFIDQAIIRTAFTALATHDLVIGPATDGGYYLIGLRQLLPELFQAIPWSTDAVLAKTLEIATANAVSYTLLPQLSDIDRPDDLAHLPAQLQ
ncbi:TIGR04282 family arsenosugar biosynthesis glycosyltransferase [filamentous cyanobacterium LEGE 11480]|uniref:TIGR04282 family arsenosugar biosynthesis glycosyltransferase n=1 Tax=Romeriopsis navalis LEGE 11480 TaxID=2777977 RepID=A0A928VM78_9CYAN|nr:TIGR04282 family arsenosugar biosynthesis glycosyltransferase [Romeriopsis navalis]MBE9028574.1 TIGR04282 family arsenosugar biosynthesis glycosyltransferase [Romeriopsis navalis LEGE 11480]